MQTLFAPAPAAGDFSPLEEPVQDFEIVLGRRQVAGVMFLATVVVVLCSAGGYVAGRGKAASMAPAIHPVALPPAPAAVPKPAPVEEPAIFGEVLPGQLYIQMAAVERGMAVIFAEGLRKKGLFAFVAPGPSEKIFRVLIGPLRDAEATKLAQARVSELGLATFLRRYEANNRPSGVR